MTVKELKKALENVPDDLEVFITEKKTEFEFGLVESVEVKEIGFSESPGDKPMATDKVLVISE